MANSALEILGMLLTLIGLIGAAATTGMPMWRVTAFIGENIIVFETRYEGLWMNCFRQADIRMQCKAYDSLLALSADLQAARGLMCASLALGALGLLVGLVGMQCTSCVQNNDRAKRMILVIAGVLAILAGLCVIVPVSWTAHVIIRDFYNPLLIDAQRRELGEALYLGWVSAVLLIAGGCFFACCNLQSSEEEKPRRDGYGYAYGRQTPPYMSYTPQYQPQSIMMAPPPQPRSQPMMSRHPSTNYSYQYSVVLLGKELSEGEDDTLLPYRLEEHPPTLPPGGTPSYRLSSSSEMVQGIQEIAAMLVGLAGLVGVAATTGMPMWKVTAFIGENIIVMETRWEGLWMNCYRQASIRMQCKVYDSLLFLPADLQAARGLMCCSLALSGLGLLVALAGMRCVSCVQQGGNERAKVLILVAAGAMQLAACVCVLIPVSWTGHVIIRDFYNPLLIDAQRRELGEALYLGWVTGAFLFASGCLFACRRLSEDKGAYYRQGVGYHPPRMRYDPVSSVVSSLPTGSLLLPSAAAAAAAGHGLTGQPAPYRHNGMAVRPFHPHGQFYPVESGGRRQPVFPPASMAAHHGSGGGHYPGSVPPSRETSSVTYASHPSTSLYTLQPMPPMMPPMLALHHPSMSSSSHSQYTVKPSMMPRHHQPHSMSAYTGGSPSFHPAVPQNPLFIRYHESGADPPGTTGDSGGGRLL
ncbi:unnamed protein product [Boreogadus saida]